MISENKLRRHSREPMAGRVRVSWVPSGGVAQCMMASAVDISESGLRIDCKEALPVGQYVRVEIDAIKLRGQASVRSCAHRKMLHEIGLEFSTGLKWKPAAYDAPSAATH